MLKGKNDNSSVGLISYKPSDKTVVEWSLRGINKPLVYHHINWKM